MAEEEKKNSSDAAADEGSGFWGWARRVGEGYVDAMAQRSPILGIPLQVALETPDYQDQQMRRERARLDFAHAQARNKEWEEGAGARKAQREAEEMRAEEFTKNAPTRAAQDEATRRRAEEYNASAGDRADQLKFEQERRDLARRKFALDSKRMDAAEAALPQETELKSAQTQLALSRTRLAQEQADAVYKNGETSGYAEGLRNDLKGNPSWEMLSYEGQNELLQSPPVRNLFDARYYLENIMGIAKGDQTAFDRMDRILQRAGMRLVDGPDGIKYLDIGKGGMSIPATKAGIDAIMRLASRQAAEELNTRASLSDTATMGNPVKRSIAGRARALMPYYGNDATKSVKLLQGIYDGASDEEKGWHMFNQAIMDFRGSGLPMSAKMDGLKACLPFLQKMGYAIDGFDEKNPNIEALTVVDLGKNNRMTFGEFAELCRANDSLGARLDGAISDAKKEAVSRDKALFARDVAETRLALSERRQASREAGRGGGSKKSRKSDEDSSDDWFSSAYGGSYTNASDKDKRRMRDAALLYERAVNKMLQERGVRRVDQLSQEDLQKLNELWKELHK